MLVLKAGEPISKGFKAIVPVKVEQIRGYLQDGVYYCEVTGEIGFVGPTDTEWRYKLRGLDGKPLVLLQDGSPDYADDLWIDQPHEVLDRHDHVLFRSPTVESVP